MQEMKETGGQEDPLEKGIAIHSGIPAWRIPRTEEPGGLWSIALHRAGYALIYIYFLFLTYFTLVTDARSIHSF